MLGAGVSALTLSMGFKVDNLFTLSSLFFGESCAVLVVRGLTFSGKEIEVCFFVFLLSLLIVSNICMLIAWHHSFCNFGLSLSLIVAMASQLFEP